MAPRNGKQQLEAVAGNTATVNRADVGMATVASRIVITAVAPQIDGGLFPVKAVCGQRIVIEADIFMDGHDRIAARVVVMYARSELPPLPLRDLGNDRWRADFEAIQTGRYQLLIEAWLDQWGSFRAGLEKKHQAGKPLSQELAEGRKLIEAARRHAAGMELQALQTLETELQGQDESLQLGLLLSDTTAALMTRADPRHFQTRADIVIQIEVERTAAAFGAWYELFPRSQARNEGAHGTFDDVIGRLPFIRAMGFDVLYMPPIHPIGTTNRKGRNNGLQASPGEPGSPYAIGSSAGGHDAVHPELGGIEGFRRLRAATAQQGMELALDFAVQCSPDHPWLRQHPEWFSWRPDGSIRHAENPPKTYEDIVNVDFHAPGAMPALWLALRDVVRFWIDEGVKLFRVDNPHTKPLSFWTWLIADIRADHPDVIFLAEAFTRPAMMYRLAKIGFSQSYTYFTWRNDKQELTEYLTELTQEEPRHYYRPHFFVNTPDINPYFLQTSGRGGFLIRAALAATLSGLWGLYSGFELCEAAALPGKEEYLNSEKYEIRQRDWQAPGNIIAEISRLNYIRRTNPALHTHLGLKFYNSGNEQILFYGKATPDLDNFILVAVSLDPHHAQETQLEVPLWEFGLGDAGELEVEELMRGIPLHWKGKRQHWYFDPREIPFAIWRVQRPGARS
jgi:starch synthase (maltosyl-transferring)